MLPFIGPLLGVVSSVVGGFFGFKKEQANVIGNALEVLGKAGTADANYANASAKAIDALYNNGPPIERLWRPIFMWVIMGLVIARWFGFIPPHIDPSEVQVLYTFLEIGLIGYIPLRSVDKWMRGFQIGNILKTFIQKKIG